MLFDKILHNIPRVLKRDICEYEGHPISNAISSTISSLFEIS